MVYRWCRWTRNRGLGLRSPWMRKVVNTCRETQQNRPFRNRWSAVKEKKNEGKKERPSPAWPLPSPAHLCSPQGMRSDASFLCVGVLGRAPTPGSFGDWGSLLDRLGFQSVLGSFCSLLVLEWETKRPSHCNYKGLRDSSSCLLRSTLRDEQADVGSLTKRGQVMWKAVQPIVYLRGSMSETAQGCAAWSIAIPRGPQLLRSHCL